MDKIDLIDKMFDKWTITIHSNPTKVAEERQQFRSDFIEAAEEFHKNLEGMK